MLPFRRNSSRMHLVPHSRLLFAHSRGWPSRACQAALTQSSRMTSGIQPDPRIRLGAANRPEQIGGVVEYPKPTPPPVPGTERGGFTGLRGITEEILTQAILAADCLADIAVPQRENICGTWLRQGDLGFIFAERGLGKTWLALYLARSLAEGNQVGPWPVPKRRRVLVVDGEMPLDGMRERNSSLRAGEGELYVLNHEWLFQKSGCVLNLSHAVTQVALFRLCVAQQFELVILDNLSCLFSGLVENDADSWEQVLPWLLDLRRHKIAVVVIHHANRSGQNMRGRSSPICP